LAKDHLCEAGLNVYVCSIIHEDFVLFCSSMSVKDEEVSLMRLKWRVIKRLLH